ncbi:MULTISPECIES: hypothetical protein [Streptomyces]|uniref:hypothetical protein n=1 Tax=Streptomyces TaxID=1883 RepID=UPI0004C6EE34|nr:MULTISPECIES: hypothetical protein [Streptomyces]QHF95820.1 hypothetical protein DEH18_20405 [Streptomyces sp. NHF165]
MKKSTRRATTVGIGTLLAVGAIGAPQAQALDVWVNPGHSKSGKSYVHAARAAFTAKGDRFTVYDDAKDGYQPVVTIFATKADGRGISGSYWYDKGGKTHGTILHKNLKEGSKVKFRLCMSNGRNQFACGKYRTTTA